MQELYALCDLIAMAAPCDSLFGEDYRDNFEPQEYLTERYPGQISEYRKAALKCFHEFFQSYPISMRGQLKILDYGAGPTIAYQISASQYASEIVLADYTEKNLGAVQLWLDGDSRAHDWSPYFKYVVQELEGRSEKKVRGREEELRRVIRAVVSCDISQESAIQNGYEGPYDIVVSCTCLEVACATKADFAAAILKLSKFLKPDGMILVLISLPKPGVKDDFYKIGSNKYYCLLLDEDFIRDCLRQAGFCNVDIRPLPIFPQGPLMKFDKVFITAKIQH